MSRNILTPGPGCCESGDEDVFPVVVEVGEMAKPGSKVCREQKNAPQGSRPSGAGLTSKVRLLAVSAGGKGSEDQQGKRACGGFRD